MKGIILKDLYENFRIFKNGVSYLAAVLFLFLLIEAMQTGDLFSLKYFFMLITAFVFPLLGCSSIESSLEQDEKVNFDKIQLTFPITKTEIVLSKYILGICFLTICNVFSLIFVFSFTAATTKSLCRKGCLHGGSEFFSPLSFLQSLILHSFCSEGNLVLSFISLSPCFSEEYTEPFPL